MAGEKYDPIVNLPLNVEELDAISSLLHGRAHVRFNPEETWTAEKMMELRTRVDIELALMRAEIAAAAEARAKALLKHKPISRMYTCTSGLPEGTCSCYACHGG